MKTTDVEVIAAMQRPDVNANGVIEYNEFKMWWYKDAPKAYDTCLECCGQCSCTGEGKMDCPAEAKAPWTYPNKERETKRETKYELLMQKAAKAHKVHNPHCQIWCSGQLSYRGKPEVYPEPSFPLHRCTKSACRECPECEGIDNDTPA